MVVLMRDTYLKNDQGATISNTLLMSYGKEKVCIMIDMVVNIDNVTNYLVKFLNLLTPLGMLYHMFILCMDTPNMLLQNLKPLKLCNGIRLKIKAIYCNILGTILTGCV